MCPPPASGNANAHASRHQVVVIGGGIAGLTAVKVCQDHGVDAHERSLGRYDWFEALGTP